MVVFMKDSSLSMLTTRPQPRGRRGSMTELIEPIAAGEKARAAKAAGGSAGVGTLRPKRARITQVGE